MTNYLQAYGKTLISLGYDVVPIPSGSKGCLLPGWSTAISTEENIDTWAQKYTGCGIRGPNTVGADLDILEKSLTQQMLKFVRKRLGYSPFRVGLSPKILLPFRCEQPFKKVSSAIFCSPDGKKHKVEILADGQQFVVSHIHPDTKKPYVWHYQDGLKKDELTTPRADLPIIREGDALAIVTEFEKLCTGLGWERLTPTPSQNSSKEKITGGEQFIQLMCPEDQCPIVRDALLSMPSDDRDLWQRMGHALKVEMDDWARDLWIEWSSHSDKYNSEEAEKTWNSFKPIRTDYRSILAEAQRQGWSNPNRKGALNDHNAIVRGLAKLSPIEYDQIRESEAEKLGVRVSTLDKTVETARRKEPGPSDEPSMFVDVEPWPEAIKGELLLNKMYSQINRHIVCDEATKIAITLWCAFTWYIDAVSTAALAAITSPDKRCGKSTLLALIGMLSRRPLASSNITSAAIFRVVEAHKPTLLIDEADSFMKENDDMRGIINSGHTRSSAYVIRTVGDEHVPTQFSTWGAKAIAGIGKLPETIMDRSIVLNLRRKLRTEKVERLRYADPKEFAQIRQMLARFALDNEAAIKSARPVLPEELNDRAQENWEPLLAIADLAQGDWPAKARAAALNLANVEQGISSLSEELLADIKQVFDESEPIQISTAALITALCADQERPWATYNRGLPITPKQLSARLKEYDIKSRDIKFGHMTVNKGYKLDQFQDAFNRYLVLPEMDTTPQLFNDDNDLSVAEEATGSATSPVSATSNPLVFRESRGPVDDLV